MKSTTGWAWEAVALDALEHLGRPSAYADIETVASGMGFEIGQTLAANAMLVGSAILVSPRLTASDRKLCVARILARWLLARRGLHGADDAVAQVADALLRRITAAAPSKRSLYLVEPVGLASVQPRSASEPRAQLRLVPAWGARKPGRKGAESGAAGGRRRNPDVTY